MNVLSIFKRYGMMAVRLVAAALTLLIVGAAFGETEAVAPWQWALALVAVVVVDSALAFASGMRGRKLGISAVQTSLVVVLVALNGSGPESWTVAGVGWLAMMAVLSFVGLALFYSEQATWLWLMSGAALFGAMNSQPGLFFVPLVQDDTSWAIDLAFRAVTFLLAFGSIGAFGRYMRRAVRSGRTSTRVRGRLWLAVLAIAYTMAIAVGVMALFSAGDVAIESMNSSTEMSHVAHIVAAGLQADFTPAQIREAGPAVRSALLDYSRSSYEGLTIIETTTAAVILAVRDVPPDAAAAAAGETTPTVVTLSKAETNAIFESLQKPWEERFGIGSVTLVDSPTSTVLLVASPSTPDFILQPNPTVDDVLGSSLAFYFPVIFAVVLLPVSIALLVLEKRDAALSDLLFAQERARLSRDAHDRVYNRMTALANRLEGADPGSGAASAGEVRGALGDLQRILGDVDARASVGVDAGPELFDDLVADAAERWGMKVTLAGGDALAGLDPRLSWELQCIVEEALTNAGKHGHATNATVLATREDRTLRTTVADDGSGIVPAIGTDGLPVNASGLRGMLERVNTLGGTLKLTSSGEGTSVNVEVPL